jgi:hypothetical protein
MIGSLLFFAFHCYYSNKQERFILPFIPFFIILGVSGFFKYYKNENRKSLMPITRFAALLFIVLNTAGLFVLSFTYSKKNRVEAMKYLRDKNVSNLVMEAPGEIQRPPLFYLGKQINFYTLSAVDSIPKLSLYIPGGPAPEPNYLIMSGDKEMEQRVQRLKKLYPGMLFEKEVRPGFVDNIAYRLNPKHNDNETWFIYRIR